MGRKWLPVGGLLLLSLLWAMGWVRADLSPGAGAGLKLSPLWREAVLLGVFAGLATAAGAILRRRWPTGNADVRTLLTGFGLFVVPSVLSVLLQGRIDDTSRVAWFSLTPLFAVIFAPHLGMAGEREVRGGFSGAMAAVAGTFLVFPVELPHSYGSAFALLGVLLAAASVAAANCLAVEIVQSQNVCPLPFAAITTGAASILLGIAGLMAIHRSFSPLPFDAWAISDFLALVLLFWLMRKMSAVQMTTRFLIAPLLANLISIALLRPHLEIQAWIGLLLIAAGAGWMLFAPSDVASESNPGILLR